MKNVFFIVGMLFFFSATGQEIQSLANKSPDFGVKEFHQRAGLANVFNKINTQRQVRIGYFGGSITEAENGWRNLTFSWFRLAFPQTAFYQIPASIGGTGSDFGAFRIDQDLLASKPDLVFVEFAVNDASRSKESIVRTMEGIVRKIWTSMPETDICFIYTISESSYKSMVENGGSQATVEAMEEVASHYNIPSIHVGHEVARLYKEGKLVFSGKPEENARTIVFTEDRTHPLPESGHPLYAGIIVRYLSQMSMPLGKSTPHLVSKPYNVNHFQRARMVDLTEVTLEGTWNQVPEDHSLKKMFKQNAPTIYKASPGAVMRFKFNGTAFGFFDCIGPGTGMLEILIDGKKQEQARFDKYCHYFRRHYFIIDSLKNGVHDVQITVSSKTLDKQAILKTNYEKNKDLTVYAQTDWYPMKVMILGEMVK